MFSKLLTSKNFQTAVGYSSERQEEIFTLSRQAKHKAPAGCWKPIAAPADRKQAEERESSAGKNLFYVKVCVRLLGLIHSALKSLKPIGLTHKVLRSRSFARFNSLYAPAAAYIAFRTKQKRCVLILSPGTERRTALQMLSLTTTSKNSLAPSS